MEVLLKTFVSETIKEIIEGVKEAQKHVITIAEEEGIFSVGGSNWQNVEFDISVTTSESSEKGKKAGLLIKVIDLGVHDSQNLQHSAINRIKFQIPIAFRTKGNEKPKPKTSSKTKSQDSFFSRNRY